MIEEEALRTHQVAKLIGRSVSVLQTLRQRDKSFPRPVVKLSRERLWRRCDVEEWMGRNGAPANKDAG